MSLKYSDKDFHNVMANHIGISRSMAKISLVVSFWL